MSWFSPLSQKKGISLTSYELILLFFFPPSRQDVDRHPSAKMQQEPNRMRLCGHFWPRPILLVKSFCFHKGNQSPPPHAARRTVACHTHKVFFPRCSNTNEEPHIFFVTMTTAASPFHPSRCFCFCVAHFLTVLPSFCGDYLEEARAREGGKKKCTKTAKIQKFGVR